jgi:hypothetical protein
VFVGWVRAVVALTEAELTRLVRTEEVWRYLMLPALLLLPGSLFAVVAVMSALGPTGEVALPPDVPVALEIPRRLEEDNVSVRVVDDPAAAWEAGEVDAAVVSVVPGHGVQGADGEDNYAWNVHLLTDSDGLRSSVTTAFEEGARDMLADAVALAGGDPARDLDVAELRTSPAPIDPPIDPAKGAVAYLVFTLGISSFFFLSLPVVADRREGVTEALRALPVPTTAPLWGRLLAMTALQVVGAAAIVGNILLLLAPLVRGDIPGMPTWAEVPGALACVVFVNALHVLVGVLSSNAKAANNASGGSVIGLGALLGVGLLTEAPAWVPVSGVYTAATAGERAIAVVSTLVVSALILELCGWLLRTRVSLVLRAAD